MLSGVLSGGTCFLIIGPCVRHFVIYVLTRDFMSDSCVLRGETCAVVCKKCHVDLQIV